MELLWLIVIVLYDYLGFIFMVLMFVFAFWDILTYFVVITVTSLAM
jgi:hypothetical protein